MTYDLLIQNSRVADGTGQPAYQADVAVLDGKIAQIAPSIPADCARKISRRNTILRSFREEYQKEMDRQGTFHLDAERVSDEIHHHKLKNARRRRAMASVASAAAVFLLLGGVATAMNYGSSFIQVRHNGFSITGPQQADAGGEAGKIGRAHV